MANSINLDFIDLGLRQSEGIEQFKNLLRANSIQFESDLIIEKRHLKRMLNSNRGHDKFKLFPIILGGEFKVFLMPHLEDIGPIAGQGVKVPA